MFFSFLSYFKESQDIVFWAFALFGTMLFFLRVCSSWLMHSNDGDGDHCDFESDTHDSFDSHSTNEHHGAKSSLKLFSIHSISGFFMMLGWVGLACTKQLEYSPLTSIIIAFIAGIITMVATGLIFKWSLLLINPGSQFDIKKTIGQVATVYQRIPQKGLGKIQLEVDGMNREILAQSLNNNIIESFEYVKVLQVLDNETVIVEKINSQK